MTPKLTDEMRQELARRHGRPIDVEDDQTQQHYVLLSRVQFERLQEYVYDDSEMSPQEAYPLVDAALGGEHGWDAPGMEAYDEYEKHKEFHEKP